ncbi:hypothetical protein [Kitasatospora sp. NPDC050543]|uniref:hypothetical protein n=1 Tax=Kitasatospora sp. NPDC050543 TaxID=3364054 RepID=UPI00379DC070
MPSKRLVNTAVLCVVLAAGATACNGDEEKGAAAAPTTAAATAAATPTATPTPTPTTPAGLAFDTLSADEISKQAVAAMHGLASLKVVGHVTVDGSDMKFNLAADKAGNCVGTMGSEKGGSFEVIQTPDQTWVKPDAAYWKALAEQGGNPKAGAMIAELFKGRYLTEGKGKNGTDTAEESMICGLATAIMKEDPSEAGDKWAKGTAGTADGKKSFGLTVTNADGSASTMQVAAEGKPYLLTMQQGADSQMTFGDFDKPVAVQAPPADNVIDGSVFKQKLKSV